MTRTVKVVLDVEEDRFVRGMRRADASADGLDKSLKDVDGTAKSTNTTLGKTTDQLGKTGAGARKAAGDFDEMRRHAATLDRQIKETERGLSSLAKGFANTGDAKILQAISQQRGVLRDLTNVRKLLPEPDAQLGKSWGRTVMQGITSGMSSVASTPATGIAGGLIGAAMAPSIAAGISAGIAGGVGGAGIIGGIALVAKDPKIADYGKRIGEQFTKDITAEAKVFKEPVLDSLNIIEAAAARTAPKIGQIFDNSAPAVQGLTQNVVRAGEALVDSFVTASGRSAPALESLGGLVESVGGAVGDMIETMTRNSESGAAAIDDLSDSLVSMVRTTSAVVDAVGKGKAGLEAFDAQIDKGRYWLEDHAGALDMTADGYEKGSEAAELYRRGIIGAKGSVDDYTAYLIGASTGTDELATTLTNAARAARGERDALTLLSKELRAQTDPAFALLDAQAKLKDAQNAAGAAVKKHGRNSEEAREATRKLAMAAIDLEGKAGALSASFNGKLTPAMRDTLEAAGLTKRQVRDVEKQFGSAKRAGDKFAKNYKASVSVKDDDVARNKLNRLLVMQEALKKGIPLSSALSYGKAGQSRYPGDRYADGGTVRGYSPNKRADNIPALLTAHEFVQPVDAVDYYGVANMEALRSRRIRREDLDAIAAYATGGLVDWPVSVTARRTRIPSVKEAAAVVQLPAPSGGATSDFIVRAVQQAFPGMDWISKFRKGSRTLSGNLSYHAMDRAVDWPASRPMAEWWNLHYKGKTKEFISPWNDLNIHNGRRHSYGGAVYRQHSGRNAHNHIAMARGGVIQEPVYGIGASGRTYSFGEGGRPEAVIPMATGGLVNSAPSSTPSRSAVRLASDEAYLSARDSLVSLNAALKENGRWMTVSTAKGRENRQALNAAIRAAQSAAQAKYDETGSVKSANKAYDAHIARLKATLRQQGVNAATIKALVGGLGGRPAYDAAKGPSNSLATIAFTKDKMSLIEATDTAGGFFGKSWGKPAFSTNSSFGRDNLNALFAFLEQANAAAQSRYTQTGSAKSATALYNSSLTTLRGILSSAGMSKKEIDALLKTYGRITLGNRMGGVYEHAQAGVLRDAHIAAGGPTRYAYAEQATGGELFAPKRGNLTKTRAEVGWAVQNWWGGRVSWQPSRAPAGTAGGMTVHVMVHDGAVAGLVDVRVDRQFGALADAQIYATAAAG